jgi:uncharacterized protein YidB (DUF937 family)
MGLLDQLGTSLKNLLRTASSGQAPALISAMLAKTNFGNLQGLVDQLQQSGLSDQVKSWLSQGQNMPITPEQLRNALNSDQMRQIAEHFGVPADQALQMLADYLPGVVDKASPEGTIQKL